MKKILFILAIAGLAFSCTKSDDEGLRSSDESKYSGLTGDSSIGTGGSEGPGDPGGQGGDPIQSGQITAGEWNDLANWDFWNNLGQDEAYRNMPLYWSFTIDNRISVNLQNSANENLIDVSVELLTASDQVLWTAKTNNFGNAELFPGLLNNSDTPAENLKIKINGQIFTGILPYSQGINNLRTELSQAQNKKADIAFVVDATGSMGDELEYLKVELIDVIGRVKATNPEATINLGSVFYRDTDDEYVTRISNFSTDINQTIDFIKNQSANGGGDFPEAVHTALSKAVKDLQWSSNATSRIIFLVLDAPPHYEPQIVAEIHSQVVLAASKGIKIIPVVASGIDKETEFLMRFLSIATNGTYVFITNDSGIGNEHLVPTVGEYEVELLNSLIERLINKYLE